VDTGQSKIQKEFVIIRGPKKKSAFNLALGFGIYFDIGHYLNRVLKIIKK